MLSKLKKRLLKWFAYLLISMVLVSVLFTLPLRWVNPPITAFILQDNGFKPVDLRAFWSEMEDISPNVALAVIASEDQKFPTHYGFDLGSIEKALTEDRTRMRGASTITQQLAKNLYLWPGRSLVRKGIEAWFTLLLETSLPKKRIMEIYLNVVEFGPEIYGISEAARQHFKKSPHNLNQRQSALLAATLPNPKIMSAGKPSDYVKKRATDIQRQMRNLGGTRYLPW